MIQVKSLLNISDNSGCKTGKCIKIGNGFKKKNSFNGDIILVSIRKIKKNKKSKLKIQKGNIYKAFIIRTKSKYKRKNLNYIKFDKNSIILINKQLRPLGTRIIGPVLKELRKSKFMKIASLSKGFV
jgi:large subunit ribosomal protein L14